MKIFITKEKDMESISGWMGIFIKDIGNKIKSTELEPSGMLMEIYILDNF
jgi:hypothetical protein